MASGPQGHYLVAASQESFYVRVIGLATMTNSVSLQEVLTDLPKQGFRRFIFDLAHCTGFDSTFMGIVLGVAAAVPVRVLPPRHGAVPPRSPGGDARGGGGSLPHSAGDVGASRGDLSPVGPEGTAVLMVNAREEHIRLLTEVGLHRMVKVRREPVDFPPLDLKRLEERPLDPRSRIRAIIAAHENLVRLGGPNIEKFGKILETLKREFGEDAGAGS